MKTNPVTVCETTSAQTIHTKPRIIKNVAVLCIGVLLLFISYDGQAMLQSTMNSKGGVGVMSQAVLYICFSVSALIFPKYVIKKLGRKRTYAFSMLTYIPYVASNFYPHWSLMIPTSILIGFGAPLLWASQDNYLNDVSVMFTKLLIAEESKHHQTGKDNLSYDEERQSSSHGWSVNSVSVENDGVASYRKKEDIHSEFEYPCTSCTNNDQGYVAYHTNNHDENYKGAIAKNSSAPESVPPHRNSSSKHPSSCHHDNFVSVGQITSSENIGNELNGINANVKSEVTTSNNLKKAIKSTTVPTFLGSNETIDKEAKLLESITARFFGVHGLMFLSSQIWSNLMTYYVLKGDEHDSGLVRNSSCKCGADFCNTASATCLQGHMQLPSDATRYLLSGVCVCLALASAVVVFLFLDPVEVEKEKDVRFSLDMAAATFKLAKRTELLLLMPSTLYVGMVQGFFAGDFTKSFVGCAWGSTSNVGPVVICYGTMCAISSFTAGWIVRLAGRLAVFTFAALLNAATCILMIKWTPDPSQPAVFFVAAGMVGCYAGIMWPQLRAFYGVLFKKDEETAFATFNMWFSLGFCVSFAFTNYLCTYIKIYVLLAISTVGFAGWFNVQIRHAKDEIKYGHICEIQSFC